ncbi:HEPN domain-containing protein [Enterobacter hormaechei]
MVKLRGDVSMKIAFARGMINRLCRCFFYRHNKEIPCIQVGKPLQDIIFWLKYNDEEVAKCASALLRNYGEKLGISDLHSAKQLLLSFCSEAFNCIDADFLSLNPEQRSVDSIISKVHRENLCEMFGYYITSQMKLYPYIYNLRCVRFDGQLKLQDNLYLYGPGQGAALLSNIKSKAGIDVYESFFDEKDIRDEPIGRYFNHSYSTVVLIYAPSQQDAVEMLNLLFGGLCVTVNNPFTINSCDVNNKIESFSEGRYHISNFRVNIPSLLTLNIDGLVCEQLVKILSRSDKRVLSALSFIAHGWGSDRRERFLNQFIALDAMYGNNAGNKASIIGGVCRDAISIFDVRSKIEIIYELRCRFVHGDISTLSAHVKYLKFVDCHGSDPVESLFEILKECVLNYQGVYEAPKEYSNSRTMNVPVELAEDVKKMIESFKNGK